MNAEQTRKLTIKAVHNEIKKAANDGKFEVHFACPGLPQDVMDELIADGFTVDNYAIRTNVSWYNKQ